MALRCFTLTLTLLAGLALGSNLLRSSERASNKAQAHAMMRSHMLASMQANMKIRANLQLFAAKAKKFGIKLPWANMDADGGEEYEFGNDRDDISDPKLFSLSQYDHTSATDDADVAETEDDDENDAEDDSFKHGDDSLENDGDSADGESD
eukprot:gnl/MRDRNA2_/MRDRNA2_89064_c0_seq1.p1 gnl/MRDRNA2_/MRDRNA2_89064_c0~~gnl/MRDRNA2_/MRDRNA2_89064_c0_seq1.p1  ORF type:complete len:151 (+),score=50.52 gnl/MRDRNA2_/MRDRNA2_89064_c0_seq1:73-525(+)